MAEIWLDRPAKGNALTMAMIERLGTMVTELARTARRASSSCGPGTLLLHRRRHRRLGQSVDPDDMGRDWILRGIDVFDATRRPAAAGRRGAHRPRARRRARAGDGRRPAHRGEGSQARVPGGDPRHDPRLDGHAAAGRADRPGAGPSPPAARDRRFRRRRRSTGASSRRSPRTTPTSTRNSRRGSTACSANAPAAMALVKGMLGRSAPRSARSTTPVRLRRPRHRGLPGGRPRLPREAPAGLQEPLTVARPDERRTIRRRRRRPRPDQGRRHRRHQRQRRRHDLRRGHPRGDRAAVPRHRASARPHAGALARPRRPRRAGDEPLRPRGHGAPGDRRALHVVAADAAAHRARRRSRRTASRAA